MRFHASLGGQVWENSGETSRSFTPRGGHPCVEHTEIIFPRRQKDRGICPYVGRVWPFLGGSKDFFFLNPTLLFLKCFPFFFFNIIMEKHNPKTYRRVLHTHGPYLSTHVDLYWHVSLALQRVEDTSFLADRDCILFPSRSWDIGPRGWVLGGPTGRTPPSHPHPQDASETPQLEPGQSCLFTAFRDNSFWKLGL